MQHVHMVGLEIEGGWFDNPLDGFRHDGSVRFPRRVYKVGRKNPVCKEIKVGEIASNPMSDLTEVRRWIYRNWPDKRNITCGFHIHVSLRDNYRYSLLMSREFYDLFLESAAQFAHKERMPREFFKRLKGENRFCRREFRPESQVYHNFKTGDRYTHLNYCFNLRGTLENRLPCGAMPKGKALKTVHWFVDLIESYLDKTLPKQKGGTIIFEVEEKPQEETVNLVI